MEVICVNDSFTLEQLEFYKKHGVKTPKYNKIYNIRDVIHNITGEKGFLLEEIINPSVPLNHPLFEGGGKMEPNWSVRRFRKLDGSELTNEELREIQKLIKQAV